jgi:hypothetical protein
VYLKKKNVSCNLTQSLLFLNVYVIKKRRIILAVHAARTTEGKGAYMILVGRPEERRPLRRPKRGWEDNIKMGLQEVEWRRGLD